MPEIHETRLPGVGIRFDFTTQAGERIGVIVHRNGRHELIVCSAEDPDVCRNVVRLEENEVRALAEILGQSHVTEEVQAMRLTMQELSIDWIPIHTKAPCASCTLSEANNKGEVPATIVALIRDEEMIPAPPADFLLKPGDTAIVVGTPTGIELFTTLLQETGPGATNAP